MKRRSRRMLPLQSCADSAVFLCTTVLDHVISTNKQLSFWGGRTGGQVATAMSVHVIQCRQQLQTTTCTHAILASKSILYNLYAATIHTYYYHYYSITPHTFTPGLKPSFLQILPTVAFLFIFGTDCMFSPYCLQILLSVSVYYFLVFLFSTF